MSHEGKLKKCRRRVAAPNMLAGSPLAVRHVAQRTENGWLFRRKRNKNPRGNFVALGHDQTLVFFRLMPGICVQ